MLHHLPAFVALLMLQAQPVVNKATDPVADSLGNARLTYEKRMNELRQDVLKSLDRKIERLRSSGGQDNKHPDGLVAARQNFEESGVWPQVTEVAKWLRDYAGLRKNMAKAYEKAAADYRRDGKEDIASIIENEWKAFETESDAASFKAIEAPSDPFVASDQDLHLNLSDSTRSSYRLDIALKQVDGNGPLSLIVPLPDGRTCAVTSRPNQDRIILSVRNSIVSGDWGVERPITIRDIQENSDSKQAAVLRLTATSGRYEITSVSVKPLAELTAQEKEPPGEEAVAQAPLKRVVANPLDKLVEGATLNGDWVQNSAAKQLVKLDITRRTNNEIEFKTRGYNGVGSIFWRYEIKGNELVNLTLRYQGPPPGRSYHGTNGRGYVRPDGFLVLEYGTLVNGPGFRNRQVEGAMRFNLDP